MQPDSRRPEEVPGRGRLFSGRRDPGARSCGLIGQSRKARGVKRRKKGKEWADGEMERQSFEHSGLLRFRFNPVTRTATQGRRPDSPSWYEHSSCSTIECATHNLSGGSSFSVNAEHGTVWQRLQSETSHSLEPILLWKPMCLSFCSLGQCECLGILRVHRLS